MEKYSKLSLKIFIITIVMFMFYVPSVIYLRDPLQVWHKNFKGPETYSHIRHSAKALIRNYDFDSVIIGNSHSENTSAKMAENLLGGKFFNLSISGSTMKEKQIILNYLFKQKRIKKVVYIVDIHYQELKKEAKAFSLDNYDFLYNENPFDDYRVYLNNKYIYCTLGLAKISSCTKTIANMDKPYAWENNQRHMARFGGFNKWIENKKDGQIKEAFEIIMNTSLEIASQDVNAQYKIDLKKYVNEGLISLIESNPDIEFYLVIPPVSNIELAISIRNGTFNKQKVLLDYLVMQSQNYSNLKIYAFDDENSIGKVENYKDLFHFNPQINSYILASIKNGKHQVDYNNINKYIKATYVKALSVDLQYYQNLVREVVQ